ncbi:hypothetical protein BGX26_006872 [Mortierella sp. AD094]|nr:hypothetical protein BGX26_006872 [Mortierella sp. AD094]
MIHSLAFSAASKKLMRDENDTSEDIVARGVSYILFYSVCDNLVRWSYGVKLLSRPKKEESTAITTSYNSINNPDLERGATQATGDSKPRNSLGYRILKFIESLTTPPLVTAVLALFVGLIPPLHRLFMDQDSDVYSFVIRPLENCGRAAVPMILLCLGAQVTDFASSKPAPSSPSPSPSPSPSENNLTPVSTRDDEEDTISEEQPLLAAASTSAVTPSGLPLPSSSSPAQNKQKQSGSKLSSIVPVPFILISRMLLVPLAALPLILFCPPELSPHVTSDPAFRLSLVVMVSSPTAINLIQICQINGYLERPMAGVLFWNYCVAGLPSVLIWAVVGLWAASWI